MSMYHEIKALFERETEVLFGSFNPQDCRDEMAAERESWKGDGYKQITIVSRMTEDTPDRDVYPELY